MPHETEVTLLPFDCFTYLKTYKYDPDADSDDDEEEEDVGRKNIYVEIA